MPQDYPSTARAHHKTRCQCVVSYTFMKIDTFTRSAHVQSCIKDTYTMYAETKSYTHTLEHDVFEPPLGEHGYYQVPQPEPEHGKDVAKEHHRVAHEEDLVVLRLPRRKVLT